MRDIGSKLSSACPATQDNGNPAAALVACVIHAQIPPAIVHTVARTGS